MPPFRYNRTECTRTRKSQSKTRRTAVKNVHGWRFKRSAKSRFSTGKLTIDCQYRRTEPTLSNTFGYIANHKEITDGSICSYVDTRVSNDCDVISSRNGTSIITIIYTSPSSRTVPGSAPGIAKEDSLSN